MTDPADSNSLWQHKPWWCQPWSIVLTGLALPAIAWGFTHRLWLTLPVVGVVLGWWTLFLYLAPRQYADAMQHQQSPQK
ncbi:DUF6737 family protein [Leptolyngbya sp. PCC 6406]|uniref:DUF6737 family protein n=1 Tax=Leptolyngbya sp. PCC 6406 TaxID=1173264 RepID=UPI0002ABAA89|nr:DUF6737 family protein [Leptolyngbya sp. PCC 6406]